MSQRQKLRELIYMTAQFEEHIALCKGFLNYDLISKKVGILSKM